MSNTKKGYHHGDLKQALVLRGMEVLADHPAEALSFRSLAADLGVTKNAPYRHFRDRAHFLGALINQGYHMLYEHMVTGSESKEEDGPVFRRQAVSAMGRAYMDFAVHHRQLYRLMNLPLSCSLDEEHSVWPRRALALLASTLSGSTHRMDENSTAAAWAYIHGLVLLRIDSLFPDHLDEPDWDRLAGKVPFEE